MNRTIKNNLLWFLFLTVFTFPTSALALGDALIQGLFGVLISPLIKPKDYDRRAEEQRMQTAIENQRKELEDERERVLQQRQSSQKSNQNGSLTETTLGAYEQRLNPNKLSPCPKPDLSKPKDVGLGGRTEKWNNCWGVYKFELNEIDKGVSLEGEWHNGYLNGQGTTTFVNGNKYVGEFKDGNKNGQGTFTFANGEKYVGEYKDNKRNGKGTYTSANGDIYFGEFKDSQQHGQGTWTYANGNNYVGEFRGGELHGQGTYNFKSGSKYVGEFKDSKKHGQGTFTYANGDKYVGEFKDDKKHGQGTFYHLADNQYKGAKYVGEWSQGEWHGQGAFTALQGNGYTGEWRNSQPHGRGRETYADGRQPNEGIFENGKFIRAEKVNLLNTGNDVASKGGSQRKEEKNPPEAQVNRQREPAKATHRISLQVSATMPSNDGTYTLSIQTNTDTASLKINGEELGGHADGRYTINRVARAGQETKLDIVATDVYGNSDTKTITVSRTVVESKVAYSSLNPIRVKRQGERDAVAVIIGISNYKTLPKAEFSNDDARVFYDYAIRALGVKPENIKLLVDADADEVEIIKAFKTWLPSRTKSTTDVYVYYSGHGLPTQDGQGLYILPPRADRDFISRTSIQFQEINADIQAVKPKSVTIFMDACYSGQARNGETLVASARPIALKAEKKLFPDNFTVITASQADQISLSSPDLKHGIFSYYLMKGMEGDADANKDGKITLNEMQAYLVDNVSRHAGTVGQKQVPQVSGEVNQVLVGR